MRRVGPGEGCCRAVCHASNKGPSCIVIEKVGREVGGALARAQRWHLKANYHKEGELKGRHCQFLYSGVMCLVENKGRAFQLINAD